MDVHSCDVKIVNDRGNGMTYVQSAVWNAASMKFEKVAKGAVVKPGNGWIYTKGSSRKISKRML